MPFSIHLLYVYREAPPILCTCTCTLLGSAVFPTKGGTMPLTHLLFLKFMLKNIVL